MEVTKMKTAELVTAMLEKKFDKFDRVFTIELDTKELWFANEEREFRTFMVGEIETNEAYDPSTSRNGGGYHQPSYFIVEEKDPEWVLTIHDNSCGDFGTRYAAVVSTLRGYRLAGAWWGSMETGTLSTFVANDEGLTWLSLIYKILGDFAPALRPLDYEDEDEDGEDNDSPYENTDSYEPKEPLIKDINDLEFEWDK